MNDTNDTAPKVHVQGKAEAFDRIVLSRKAYVEATQLYNSRLEIVRAERERGNWSMKVDTEFVAMTNRQQEWFRTVQDEADAALSTAAEASDA